MRRALIFLLIALVAVIAGLDAQSRGPIRRPGDNSDDPPRLPNGKSQQDAILKEDHEKDIADTRELVRIATELKDDVEKSDAHVLSVASLKKTDEIEKLAKRIRARMRRY
jgi:hypothetical protein